MRKNRTYLTLNKVAMNYKESVLTTNSELKKQFQSVGQCRSALLAMHNSKQTEFKLPNKFADYLTKSKKEQAMYTALKDATRLTKKGTASPFYVLQALYKLCK